MVANAESLGGSATANDDVRLTSFGRRIRRWKLDELPQLWNVLIGEMSLVGPRPEVDKFVALYNETERRLLDLRPGLTDWATIWNSDEGSALAGHADAEKAYQEVIRPIKLELQLLYRDHHSFTIDAKILWHTVMKLLNGDWTPQELATYGSSLKMGTSCERVQSPSRFFQETEKERRL
jgi:lipopolysaccharide/colanic/teichoic acid biosynthesis glycosyltransferase